MKLKILTITLFIGVQAFAQEQMPLENLNAFKPQAGNWQLVGEVQVNPTIDVHQWQHRVEEAQTSKRRRKRKEVDAIEAPITITPGTGILLNMNDSEKKDRLETVWKHGDIKLELEVMLPKGSNSGIYLQGRYELQLLDSWGVIHPKVNDMGGIHNNWEKAPDKIFRGIPPLYNASKAPGLWQKLKIHFQAPKFNLRGEKVANAKFVSVMLNDVVIHSNVEVSNYTGTPIEKTEVPEGPLVIQGDHGPVAFRHIKYQLLKPSEVAIGTLHYKTYHGEFKDLNDLKEATLVNEGTSELIDVILTNQEDNYGIQFSGELKIPKDGKYNISVGYSGGVSLRIDGNTITEINASDRQEMVDAAVTLTAGTHPFELTNIKSAGWRPPRLGLTLATVSTNPTAFHTYDSYPPPINSISPIYVQPQTEPRLLRAFVSFAGDGKRLSHTIGVGTPEGINYIYDMGSGNLIGAWRGFFVDATPMWHERGDGSFKPRGAVQWTFLNQPVAQLSNLEEAFPDTGDAPDYISKGYVIDAKTGLPVFKHRYKGVEIENFIVPNSSNTHVIREIRFSKMGLQNWYCKLAAGTVENVPDGSYRINGEYYIKIRSGQVPVIRTTEGTTELVIPIDGSKIEYELIW